MKTASTIFAVIGGSVLLLSVIFGLNYFAYGTFNFFAPKYEATRRDVMINSRAYSEGTIRELYRLKAQYEAADPIAKATIAAAARHEFQIFPQDRLPADLQGFMMQASK
jgi:hypothetical protein